MEYPHCHDCEERALYQCVKDKQYLCSHHNIELHMRHKIVSISGEVQRRQVLAETMQRNIRTLEQGLQVSDRLITRSLTQAESTAQAWIETQEEWIAVHRNQLESLRTLASQGQESELYETLLARLRCNFSDPLLRFSVHMPS
jgi:hypothetical protein